jgi:hypothetical protein
MDQNIYYELESLSIDLWPVKNLNSYLDITFVIDGLQSLLVYVPVLQTFERKSLSCHICCGMEPWISWVYPEICAN